MTRKLTLVVALAVGSALAIVGLASADSLGPINFESYTAGNIDGQHGWSKTGPYDAEVANVSSFPAAAGYGFGSKALRISDAVTSGAFSDQTFSPALANDAGETGATSLGGTPIGTRQKHFDMSFQIGTTKSTEQPGLHLTVSPDSGAGDRMSYLRFEDQSNGVHVFFDDVSDPGPLGAPADFNERSVGVLSRSQAHTIRMTIDFNDGPGNDVVQVFVDGALKATGTTWEDYYRYDPEQAGNGNKVPTVDKVLFRESGTATPADLGQGFLIDNLGLASGPTPSTGGGAGGGTAGGTGAGGVAGVTGSHHKCKHKRHHRGHKCKRHRKHH